MVQIFYFDLLSNEVLVEKILRFKKKILIQPHKQTVGFEHPVAARYYPVPSKIYKNYADNASAYNVVEAEKLCEL